MSKIVIALGGNALGKSPGEQLSILSNVSKIIVDLIEEGNKIIITHGNGPQVGQISLAFEYANNKKIATPYMPFAECGSMSEGYIGYHIEQSIMNELTKRNIEKSIVTLITEVLVDKDDLGFKNPTKPIGMYYTQEEASIIQKEKGYIFKEEKDLGYRRVVPSPIPKKILNDKVIKQLMEEDIIVICSGGGGIPVIIENNTIKGIDAVIDKDKSSSLLAKEVDADILLILTTVDKVSINYNKPNQKDLDIITTKEAQTYINNKEFSPGSMLPKIEACINFVEETNKIAIITSLEQASNALLQKSGTRIIKEDL